MLPNLNLTDVVGIYTQDFRQVLVNARPLKVTPSPENKVMEHPVETGATISDHVVTLPVRLELSLIILPLNLKSTYEEIKQLSQNRTLLTVQTKAGVYKNLIILSYAHQEDPEMFDVLSLALKLQEVLFAQAQFGGIVPRNPTNQSTQARGNVQTTTANEGKSSSVIKSFSDYVSGKFKP